MRNEKRCCIKTQFTKSFISLLMRVIHVKKDKVNRKRTYKNNSVVGAEKYVINDIENSQTLKTKHKKYGFLLFVLSRYGFSKTNWFVGFPSKIYAVFCLKSFN